MGIDGIGKGGRAPPTTTPASGATNTPNATSGVGAGRPETETGRAFDVNAPSAEKAGAVDPSQAGAQAHGAAQAGAAERTALERLKAGEIDVNGYVDLKVEKATANLKGLSRVELDHIRTTLKQQMQSDPAILDLVKQATGSVPSTSDE